MTAPQVPDDPVGKADRKTERLIPVLLGGLLIGLAASLPLAVIWPDTMHPPFGVCLFGTEANPVERIWVNGRIIPLPCMPTFLFIQPAVGGGFLGAGIVFGLIARELAASRSVLSVQSSRWLPAALGGFSFLILSFLGSWLVPRLTGPGLPLFLSSGVAAPFAVMVFGISFLFALAMGLAFRTPGVLWRASLAATVTAFCHGLVTWILLGSAVMLWTQDSGAPPLAHSLPVLGNGMGPMMTTIVISNFISGTIGGCVTLGLLTLRRPWLRWRTEEQLVLSQEAARS